MACHSPVGGGGRFKNVVDEPAKILTKHSSVFIDLIKHSAYSTSTSTVYTHRVSVTYLNISPLQLT